MASPKTQIRFEQVSGTLITSADQATATPDISNGLSGTLSNMASAIQRMHGGTTWTNGHEGLFKTTGSFVVDSTADIKLDADGDEVNIAFGGNVAMALHKGGDTATYINFVPDMSGAAVTAGASGMGFRNNNGTMQFKNDGGSWAGMGGAPAADDIASGDAAVSIDTSSGNITVDSNAGAVTVDGHTGVTIQSTDSGNISIDSVAELHLNSATGDIKFQDGGTDQLALDMDGTAGEVIIKTMVASDDLVFQNQAGQEQIRLSDTRGKVFFYDEGGEYIQSDGSTMTVAGGAVTIDSAATITLDSDSGFIEFKDDGTNFGGVVGASTYMAIAAKEQMILSSSAGQFALYDDGTNFLNFYQSSGDCIITSSIDDQDIIFHGNDAAEVFRVDGSAESLSLAGAGGLVVKEISAPGTPASGYGVLYATSASKVFFKNDAGTATDLTAGGSPAADDIASGDAAVSIDTSSGNITVDSNAGLVSIDGHTGVTLASSDSGDITLDSVADIVLDAAGGNYEFKNAGTAQLLIDTDTTANEIRVELEVNGDDLAFYQFDGTEVLRLTDAASVEVKDNLTLKSDSAVLGFGADTDTTLTHTDGTGLTLNSTNKLCFGDAATYVNQSADGTLSLISDNIMAFDAQGTDSNDGYQFTLGTDNDTTAFRILNNSGVEKIRIDAEGSIWAAGDLQIQGSTTTISSSNTTFQDPIIGLGVSGSETFTNAGDRGIIFAKGSAAHAALPGLWWDGTNFNLATSLTSPLSSSFGTVTAWNTLKVNQLGLDNNADADYALFLDWGEDEDSADRTLAFAVAGGNRTLTLSEDLTIGDGSAGTLTFSAGSKTLTVANSATVDQDVQTTDTPTFAGTINSAHVALTSSIGLKMGQKLILDDDHDTYGVSSGDDLFGFLAGGKAIFSISGSTGNETTKFHRDALPLGGATAKIKLGNETHPWRALYLSGNDGDNQGRGHALISAGGGGTEGGVNSAHDLMITAGSGSNAIYLSGTDSTATYGGISFHTDNAETLPIGSLFLSLADEYGSFMDTYHVRSDDTRPTSLIAAVTSASLGQRKGRYVVTASHTIRRTLDIIDATFNNAPYGGHQFLNDDYLDVFVNGQLMFSGTDAQLGLGTADYTLSTGSSGAVIPASGLSFGFTLESDDVIQVIRRAP